MTKYKTEKYINQRLLKGGWTFQVIIRKNGYTITESFKEADYSSVKTAYDCAIAYRNKKLFEINEGTYLAPSRLTLQDVYDQMQEFSTSSLETKRKELINFDKRIPNHDILFVDVSPVFIQNSLNACVNDSQNVINKVMTIWRKLYDYAILNNLTNQDLTKKVKVPKSKKIDYKRPVLVSDDIVDKAYDNISRAKDKREVKLLQYAFLILKYTGARPGEIFALDKSDVGDEIFINKELEDIRGVPKIRPTKTPESKRMIPISNKLKPIIKELLEFSDSEHLFLTSKGGYMHSVWASARLPKGFNLYMLRHRASTIWDLNGVSLRTIDELMGHKSNMSVGYARSNNEEKQKAVDML